MDRRFPATLILGDGSVLTGESLYPVKLNRTAVAQLVALSCEDADIVPEKVKGKIVVCFHQATGSAQVIKAGGEGLVLVSSISWTRDGIMAPDFSLPGLGLSHGDGDRLRAYMT